MAGRARVFSLTLWLMARACAYLRAALAVARATAAEHACTMYVTCVGVMKVEADITLGPKNQKVDFEIFCMQVCAHRVRRMQASKRVPL